MPTLTWHDAREAYSKKALSELPGPVFILQFNSTRRDPKDSQIGHLKPFSDLDLSLQIFISKARAVRREGRVASMKQFFFERECVHRDNGRDGEVYNGMFYVQAIQRLTIEAAMKVAKQVAPFYWVDAPRVMVWLCRDCATELHIGEAPRAILQGARR